MIGGGIAGILALQAAGAFDDYKEERTQNYTVDMPEYEGPHTASQGYSCCSTGMPTGPHTASRYCGGCHTARDE